MAKVAVSTDFLEAYARIPRPQQKKVREFMGKFQANPTSAATNYETIHDMRDERVRTVRIDLAYRAIVLHPQRGDVYTLLWVDHHDAAMNWARRKQFGVNPVTGALQVVDMEWATAVAPAVPDESTPEPIRILDEYGVFELLTADDLLRLGVPQVLLPAVQNLHTAAELEKLEKYLPAEAYEALYWIGHLGYSVDQALNEVSAGRPKPVIVDVEDLETALQHPDSKRRFTIVETPAELEDILSAPLEKWRVFLHPSQADMVQRHFNGPARVLGGAGTGKTVVAMHRARHLARRVFTDPQDRILFVTYTRTLAHNISQNLDHLCGPERARIEVVHLHKWAADFLRSQRIRFDVAGSDEIKQGWQGALGRVANAEFDLGFYRAEWDNVVKANRLTTLAEYLRVPRRGQGSRLSRLQRVAIWEVFENFRSYLQESGKIEWNDVPAQARQCIESNPQLQLPYRAVIVDETQDLYPEELRLIRAIAPQGPNDLFLVGDAHQRIYSTAPVTLSHCGVNARGRSRKLRINYRTTENIRRWSLGVLQNIAVDDLDGQTDDLLGYRSLRQGQPPAIQHFPTLAAERAYVIGRIEQLVVEEDAPPESICLVFREGRQADNYKRGLAQAGIPFLYLTHDVNDDAGEGVRLATMHRVKGLEFTHIFMVGVNEGILPNRHVLAEDEEALRERCLLHVAATRARDTLTITSYGRPSPFLTAPG
jgi:hypothetical protein